MAVEPKYLVDNSAWNRLKYESVANRLRPLVEANLVATCGVIEMEALYSARNPPDYEKLRAERNSIFQYIETEEEDWQEALAIQRTLAAKSQLRGSKIPDLLMAAAARRHGLIVLHYDVDFEQLSKHIELLQEWVVERGSVA